MATVLHVTSGSGLRKFQADGFLFDRERGKWKWQEDEEEDVRSY